MSALSMSVVYLIACWVAPQHHFHNGTTPKTQIASSQCKEHCAPYTVRPPHVKATLQNAIGYRDSIQTQDDTRSQQLLPLGARGQPRNNFPRPKNAVQTTCTPALSKPCIPYQLQFLAQMHNSKHSVPWLCRATADLQHAPQAPRVKWTAVAAAGWGASDFKCLNTGCPSTTSGPALTAGTCCLADDDSRHPCFGFWG